MKALSLRQPWAHLVVHYGKNIENRVWNTKFRGDFLIHASKGMTQDEYMGALAFATPVLGWSRAERSAFMDDFEANGKRGGFVGRARIFAVMTPDADAVLDRSETCREPWHMHEQFGFRLADVRELDFIPCPGSLGFFEAPRVAHEALAAQGIAR